jgi:hypothetical protein
MIGVGHRFHDGTDWPTEFLRRPRPAMSKDNLKPTIGCRVRAHHYRCVLPALTNTLKKLAVSEIVCPDSIGDE